MYINYAIQHYAYISAVTVVFSVCFYGRPLVDDPYSIILVGTIWNNSSDKTWTLKSRNLIAAIISGKMYRHK